MVKTRSKSYLRLITKENTILFLKIYDCATANKIFKYNCQTPICYVLIQKKTPLLKSYCNFNLYNLQSNKYNQFRLYYNKCIPTNYVKDFILHNKYISSLYEKNKCQSDYNAPIMHDILLKISCLKPSIMNNKIRNVKNGELIHEKITHDEYKIITGANYIRPSASKPHGELTLNGLYVKARDYIIIKEINFGTQKAPIFYKDYEGEYGLMGRDMYYFYVKQMKNWINYMTILI